MSDAAEELYNLGKQVDEKWRHRNRMTSSLLTVDDIVAIADSIISNCLDFPCWLDCWINAITWMLKVKVKVTDEFQVHIQFLRTFLVYAKHTGIQLHGLLILIQPIAINASRVYVKFMCNLSDFTEDVQFMCSTVNGMVTELQIYDAYAQALSTSTTRSHEHADMDDDILMDFLDSLKSLLWEVLRHSDSRQDLFIELYARLRSCRAILMKQEEHPISFDRKKIKGQMGCWIHDAGFLICSLHHTHVQKDLGSISDLLRGLDAIEAQIQNTPSQSKDVGFVDHPTKINICQGDEEDLTVPIESQISSHQPPQTTTPQVVGFQDGEVDLMLDRLTRGSNQLRVVPIFGMAGIGKTTLARKLYNHRSIIYHFHIRAWCTVSQVLSKNKLLVQLLNQIQGFGSYSGMTEDDLVNNLRRSLKGKRYLILLDDVWTSEVWNSLKMSFPDDSTQSRIVLTSRYSDVAPPCLLNGKPYSLRLRLDHECFEILQSKLSIKEGWNPNTGMEIAKLCKGLPLLVVIVAGLLARVKEEGWKEILDHLRSGSVSCEEQCNSALEFSFKHLPHDLKLCFIYIGVFPEDENFSVKRLIRLWIAEGFVKRNGSKAAEDVGQELLDNLIQRSLVMVAQSTSRGRVKHCHLHDVLRDFCVTKAGQTHTFHLLNRYGQFSCFNEPRCLQRLCIHSRPLDFRNSKLFCPRAHSLLLFSSQSIRDDLYSFDMSFIIQIFKLLKVLDLEQFGRVAYIPSEIELLTRLTYISVRTHTAVVPFSIFNLFNLETLILDGANLFKVISFPQTFWNLQKLKYLNICRGFGSFSLPIDNPYMILELKTLSGVVFNFHGSMEKELSRFPNLHSLRCTVKFNKIVIPDFLNQLQSLSISGQGKLQCEFGSARNLSKVTLKEIELSREEIAVIGNLPNLEVLRLLGVSFSGGTLEMEEGEFSKLKIFRLVSSRLRKWTASDEQLL